MSWVNGNLVQRLAARSEAGQPLRVGLIGAGKFGTMFLSQALQLPNLHVLGVADLSPDRVTTAFQRAGWPPEQFAATNFDQAVKTGATYVAQHGEELIKANGLDVVIEATGNPAAGIGHALQAINYERHIVMVNVEADVLAGPVLARRAAQAGVVYSLAYGDQPALICELVDWARACGFAVVCAGKGTRHLPVYHSSTPDTVWDYYGYSRELVAGGGFNPKMFNSFLDGTKSAIEMAAVSNATGLTPQPDGLRFPPCGIDDLPHICRPQSDGGRLAHRGTVEVVSSLERDGRPVCRDLRWGVYITFEAHSDYVKQCFHEYGLTTDASGRYTAMYRPYHLVGLELTISILKAGLCGEATGSPGGFKADVVATAKRDLAADEQLDGEGGYCVYGTLVPAERSLEAGYLPIGLAHNVRLTRNIAAGQAIFWSDIDYEPDQTTLLRQELTGS